ncbi:MAG: hypothetical protein U0797_03375 [Gemmataceae bacterium]
MDDYTLKRRTIVIRHASGDRIVALLEIVSPGTRAAAMRCARSSRRPSRRCTGGINCSW